jgi:hypothetical protein
VKQSLRIVVMRPADHLHSKSLGGGEGPVCLSAHAGARRLVAAADLATALGTLA